MNLIRSRSPLLALAGLLLLVFLVYLPGLRGNFILDDYANIVDNTKVQMTELNAEQLAEAWGSGVASTLQRPVSMLSFALNHLFTEMNPYYFKLTNLLIHLLTTVGVYLLVRELARSVRHETETLSTDLFALLVTACWALHPLNVSTVLYVVQRMTQLAMLASVFTLYLYCRWRQGPISSPLRAFLLMGSLALLTVVGILGKENAVLTPLLLLCVEYFIFRFRAESDGDRWFLRLLVLGGLILPIIGVIAVLLIDPSQLIGDYSVRSFSMGERLLTQARALWSYIGWLLLPTSSALSFFHDDYQVSRGLLEPPTTLLALAGIAVLLVAIWHQRHSRPLVSFGLAFFLIGHLLESTVVSLELVFEHRNYLPGLGVLLAIWDYLHRLSPQQLERRTGLLIGVALTLYFGFTCCLEARKWGNTFTHVRSIVEGHPLSHRANHMLGMLYDISTSIVEEPMESWRRARHYYLQAIPLDPHSVRSYLGYVLAQTALGEKPEATVMEELSLRLENNQLMRDGFTEVSKLTACWYSGQCKFELNQLVDIYNAVGRNRVVDPIIVQGILDQVGSAMVTTFDRPDHGRALLYLARSKSDAVTMIDLKLAQLELQLGNIADARTLISEAKEAAPPVLAAHFKELEQLIKETPVPDSETD